MQQWKKNFFTIWLGQVASQFTSAVIQFAIVWHLTNETGSAQILAFAMFIGFFPQGLLGPIIGVYIDRYSRKMIMICADLFIASVTLLLAIAGLQGKLPVWLILTVLFLRSLGTAFHQPTLQAVTPQIVPGDQLTKCAGYSQSLQSVSQIVSPAIAAVLYSAYNLSTIILLDVLGALVAVSTLWISTVPRLPEKVDARKKQVFKEAAEGFRMLRSRQGLLGLVLISALYALALMPTSALFPLMSITYFGGTSTEASMVEVSFSVGLLIGAVILSVWGGTKNKIHTIVASFILMGVSLVATGLLPPDGFSIFVLLAGAMGISGPFFWGMFTVLLQQSFAQEFMGRVMALSTSIMIISTPIGLAFAGVFAERFGVEKWFLVAGGLTLFAALLCAGIPAVRRS